jgi:predicted negative regulator of RcsB-dependent stress response
MVTIVVLINTFISLILIYVAWRIWQLRLRLLKIANALTNYERCSHAILHGAPTAIYTRQQNIKNLRSGNQSLQLQIEQVRQIVSLLSMGQQFWRRSGRRQEFKFIKKTIAK